MKFLRLITLYGILGILPATAFAHTTLLGNIEAKIEKEKIEFKFILPEERFITDQALFENYVKENLVVENNQKPCPVAVGDLQGGNPSFLFISAVCDDDIVNLKVQNSLFIEEGYTWTGNFSKKDEQRNASFDGENQTAEFNFRPSSFWFKATEALRRAWEFIWIGMTHIWSGYDHLLFVLALILATLNWKELLKIITGFTVAHSLTLILAAVGAISVTSRIVEPLIALSIAYVAVENFVLLSKSNKSDRADKITRRRWLVASGFGLVHGLGFAGALSELQIGGGSFLTSLISFNIGVEIGQITVIAVILPLLIYVGRFAWRSQAIKVVSALIALVGITWFVLRLLSV